MSEPFTFTAEESSFHTPMAVLRAGTKVILKIYMNPEGKILRITLPEWANSEQLKLDLANQILDFKR